MSHACKISVRKSGQVPFKYSATFVWVEPADLGTPLVPADLYAEGDLAAYLEEWGAGQDDILSLLDSLESVGSAEIAIVMPDEMLEVLSSQQR